MTKTGTANESTVTGGLTSAAQNPGISTETETGSVRLTWKDVRDIIRGKILDSTYAPGDKLPRDEDIAEELGCARSTVHRAMRDLSDGGLVERRRKGGTQVRANPVTRAKFDIPITRIEVESKGSVYGYQLVGKTIERIPRSVAASFGMATPVEMVNIRALHLADGRPYVYEDRWVSLETVPEFAEVDLERESANEWLVRNKPYSRCNIRFFAKKAGETDARLLDCDPNDALFVMERTTWIGTAPITCVLALTTPGYQLLTQI